MTSFFVQGQKKVYKAGLFNNQKIKGTFLQIGTNANFTNGAKAIGAGSVIAAIAAPAINSTIGLIRENEERKTALSQALSLSDSYCDDFIQVVDDKVSMQIKNYFVNRGNGVANEFQTLNFNIENESNEYLTFDLLDFESSFSKAFIKKRKDMLVYSITLSGVIEYIKTEEGKKTRSSKEFSAELVFNSLSANSKVDIKKQLKILLPEVEDPTTDYLSFTLNATLKETNPFFQSYSMLAKYLENYGEFLSDGIKGAIVEPSED
jgi:hypothetical protein